MSEATFDVFCPTCNILIAAKVIASGCGASPGDSSPYDDVPEVQFLGSSYSIAICSRCKSPFLVCESAYESFDFPATTDIKVLFPVDAHKLWIDAPPPICRSMEQASNSFKSGSYDAAALMCRRAIEGLCKIMNAEGRNLATKLQDLENKGHIDKKLLSWAHGVRAVGNDAAHDVLESISKDDASDILELAGAILMYVFSLDRKFRDFESRRAGKNITAVPGSLD